MELLMKRIITGMCIALFIGTVHSQYLITNSDSLMNNGADYLVITHQDFTSACNPLCKLRDSLGLSVKMAEVSLIYSTFADADKAASIKKFTQQVYNSWKPRPQYILLVGDACRGNEAKNFIPSKLFPKFSYSYLGGLTEHASDNWYVQLDGADNQPDIAIGRFPVQTLDGCKNLVEKVITYETKTAPGPWQRNVCMVVSTDFSQYATELENTYFKPAKDSIIKIQDNMGNSTVLRQMVVDAFNKGIVFLFMGCHGSTTPIWTGSTTLFSSQDVSKLKNSVFPVILGRG